MSALGHHPGCEWEVGGAPCLQFSTDGTITGAEIAHTTGTTSEAEILLMGEEESSRIAFVSDVDDDWMDDDC